MQLNTKDQIAALKYTYAVLERRLIRKLQLQNPNDAELKRIKMAQLYLRQRLEALERKRLGARADVA